MVFQFFFSFGATKDHGGEIQIRVTKNNQQLIVLSFSVTENHYLHYNRRV